MRSAGIKAKDLAAAVEVYPATVSAWRNGDYMPEPPRLERIASVLMVTPQSLAGTPSTVMEGQGAKYAVDPVVALLNTAKQEQAEWLVSFSQRLVAAVEEREAAKKARRKSAG
jgi:transcriptional regulator with XRE-family HTH domain